MINSSDKNRTLSSENGQFLYICLCICDLISDTDLGIFQKTYKIINMLAVA